METKGLVYYTSHNCSEEIILRVQRNLLEVSEYPIVSVSLKPIRFGINIVLNLEQSPLTMYKQILKGLETIDTDIVFLVEHDVLYPKCHFEFTPPTKDKFYYNLNWWKVRVTDGQAIQWKAVQVSGLCAYRELLIEHYKERVRRTKRRFSNRVGFEPGLHQFPRGIDNYQLETWWSDEPCLDISHGTNVTKTRFALNDRLENVILSDTVPFWGQTKGRFDEFLKGLGESYNE